MLPPDRRGRFLTSAADSPGPVRHATARSGSFVRRSAGPDRRGPPPPWRHAFRPPRRRSGQVTVPTTGLLHPDGLALDGAGNLFIADFDNDRVVELPMRGGQRPLPVAGPHTPAGLAVPQPGRDAY
ncbi:hypothetical protein ACFXA0_20195 [Streptomyces cyaneofuscatus]|uniref:hypothetical protein n=1 Tax=Streptomyces cyaneofuscatus TaxID=66883 RepID=UPI0036B79C28